MKTPLQLFLTLLGFRNILYKNSIKNICSDKGRGIWRIQFLPNEWSVYGCPFKFPFNFSFPYLTNTIIKCYLIQLLACCK
jgi:hypothetical protein